MPSDFCPYGRNMKLQHLLNLRPLFHSLILRPEKLQFQSKKCFTTAFRHKKYSLYQELEYKTQLSNRHALTIRMVLRDVCVVYCLWQQPNLQIFAWLASNKTHVYGVNNYDKILFATFLHIRLAMPHAAGLSIFV